MTPLDHAEINRRLVELYKELELMYMRVQRSKAMVTKADIMAIHTKIDNQGDAITEMALAVKEMATTIKLLPKPEPRPCDPYKSLLKAYEGHIHEHEEAKSPTTLRREFDNHIKEHDSFKTAWITAILSLGTSLIVVGFEIYLQLR